MKKKVSSITKKIYALAKKQFKPKKVMKENKMTYKMQKYEPDNIWEHNQQFFKGEMNKEKRSLFFS